MMTSGENDTIIVDLDGTLCNSSWREHLARSQRWDEFHKGLPFDSPNVDVASLIKMAHENHIIVAVTGRPEKYRIETEDWLSEHSIEIDHLLMRKDDDFRSDTVVKPELLSRLFFGGLSGALKHVLFIIDDRDRVVAEWRRLGFKCWQVQPGGY